MKTIAINNQPEPFAPWPSYDEEMIGCVTEVLRSGRVNYWNGDSVVEFEKEFAEFVGTDHAIACSNGTVAIELALRGLGIQPGDEVIVPSRTFIATASAVAVFGAQPVCADVDRDSQNVTAETINQCLTPRTKAIIVVHHAGWPCEMDAIMQFARQHDLLVIEDCAQAHGAEYQGQPVGTWGDVGAYSFCTDKIITTGGEGGMVVTNNADVWRRMWQFKDHGKSPELRTTPSKPSIRRAWVHDSFGSNCRLTAMQAEIGRVALRRLPEWTRARTVNANRLRQVCNNQPALRTPEPAALAKHAHYKFYAFVEPNQLAKGWSRDRIAEEIGARGVPCLAGSCSEIYLEAAFPQAWRPETRWPVAEELGETSLMFVVHPTLTEANLVATEQAITEVLAAATAGAPLRRVA